MIGDFWNDGLTGWSAVVWTWYNPKLGKIAKIICFCKRTISINLSKTGTSAQCGI